MIESDHIYSTLRIRGAYPELHASVVLMGHTHVKYSCGNTCSTNEANTYSVVMRHTHVVLMRLTHIV